jgi:hypothetical protein
VSAVDSAILAELLNAAALAVASLESAANVHEAGHWPAYAAHDRAIAKRLRAALDGYCCAAYGPAVAEVIDGGTRGGER